MNPRAGFRRRDAASLASRDFGPNMTPMVDIVMVILIFFMAGSAVIGPEWFLTVGMAPGAGAATKPAEPSLELPTARTVIRLRTDASGVTLITGLELTDATMDALSARLDEYSKSGAAKSVHVVIEPAQASRYQDVIRVYDLCQRAGFAGVGLAKAAAPPP